MIKEWLERIPIISCRVFINLDLIRIVAGCGECRTLRIEELDSREQRILNGYRAPVRDEAPVPAGRSRELPHADETVLRRRYEESGLGGQVHARDPTRVSGDLHQNLAIDQGTNEYAVPFLRFSKFFTSPPGTEKILMYPLPYPATMMPVRKEDEADLESMSIVE